MLATVRRAGEHVFVVEPEVARSRRDPLLMAGAVVVLAVIAAARASTSLVTSTVWAEDGREFLGTAVREGTGHSLLRGYAGYAHVLPRLVGSLAAAVPPSQAATVFAVSACLITAALAVFCARAARGHIRTTAGRVSYAALFVLLPVAGVEVLGNVANLHWFLFVGAFWAILWRPASSSGRVASCIVVAFAAMSDPLVALLVPLALWRGGTVTEWRDRAVVGALAVALGVQAWVVVHTAGTNGPSSFHSVFRLFGQRVAVGSFLGVHGTRSFVARLGVHATDVAAPLVIAVLVVLWWRYGGERRIFIATTVVFAVTLFVACIGVRGGAENVISGVVVVGSRYTVAPVLILAAAGIALLERLDLRIAAVIGLGVALTCVIDFHASVRSNEVTWSRGLLIARTACRAGVDPTSIPIVPVTADGEWRVIVPCSYLER